MDKSVIHGSRRGMFLVMLASTMWGTSGVTSQAISQLSDTNSISLAFWRMAIAAPVMLIIGQWLLGKQMWKVTRSDFGFMIFMGSCIAISQAMYFAAITYAGVAVSTLLVICSAPVIVTIITAGYSRQRPDNLTLISVALGVIGTTLLVLGGGGNDDVQTVSFSGVALSFGAALLYAGVVITGRFLAQRYHPLQVNAVGFSAGAVVLGIAAQFVGFVATYPLEGWALLLYIGLVPTALAYALFVVGMKTTPAPIGSVLTLMEPLTATLLSWILFHEELGVLGMIGAALMIGTIYLLSRSEQ